MDKLKDHIHAAAIPLAGQTALQALRDKGGIKPGQKIMIIGAAGGVGHYALQLSNIFGAETTAVCSSGHEQLLSQLKPEHHIDYRKKDFKKVIYFMILSWMLPGLRHFLPTKGS